MTKLPHMAVTLLTLSVTVIYFVELLILRLFLLGRSFVSFILAVAPVWKLDTVAAGFLFEPKLITKESFYQ